MYTTLDQHGNLQNCELGNQSNPLKREQNKELNLSRETETFDNYYLNGKYYFKCQQLRV